MEDYGRWLLVRRIRTRRPVLEKMTEFWEAMLHVPVSGDAQFTWRVDYGDTIRRHALGRFDRMLTETTTHPAMLMAAIDALGVINKLNAQLNAQGRVQAADPAKGVSKPTVDWKDGASHLRALDRSGDQVVAVVIEDAATLSNLAALRPNKPADPNEIDPSITAVTRGTNRTDPNAAGAPAASASGGAGKKAPPKKK